MVRYKIRKRADGSRIDGRYTFTVDGIDGEGTVNRGYRHTYGYEWAAMFRAADGVLFHGKSWDRRGDAVQTCLSKIGAP